MGIDVPFVVGLMLAALVCEWYAPHNPNKSRLPSLFIPLSNNAYFHLHHWMYALLLLFVNPFEGFIEGWLCGILAQGISYEDSFTIIRVK